MIKEVSAGGVLFRKKEVLLIKNPSGVWTFPKGLIEEGEKPEEAALREVFEETGIKGKLVTHLGEIRYWYMREGQKVSKRVIFFLMEYVEGEPKASWEVQEARFFPIEEAKKLIKYKGDREVFEKSLKFIYSQDKSS
ncbi:MAG: NUDIX hydrolase [Aquificaceae bacterium]